MQLEIDKVCDIFTQINSKGIELDTFDLMNAMLRPKDLQLKQMWREAAPRLEFVDTEKMNVYILQVMSICGRRIVHLTYLYYLLPGAQSKRLSNCCDIRRNLVRSPPATCPIYLFYRPSRRFNRM